MEIETFLYEVLLSFKLTLWRLPDTASKPFRVWCMTASLMEQGTKTEVARISTSATVRHSLAIQKFQEEVLRKLIVIISLHFWTE